jgi:hypothetical protein
MNTTLTLTPPTAAGKNRQRRTTGGVELGKDASRDAKRLAAAILEVLAGARTPTDAATALGVSLPRYYQIESRALVALLASCEPRPKGRVRSPQHDLDALRKQKDRLQRELTRQQALVRAAQRTVGLPAPAVAAPSKGKKRRRRPVARALSVAARLQQTNSDHSDVVLSKENPG